MFGRKRLDELEQRVTKLEEIQKSLVKDYEALTAGDVAINTFEYGRMPLREAIRKLAKFAKKEEEAEKRRRIEKMEEESKRDCFCKADKPDYTGHAGGKLMRMCEERGGMSRDEILREIANEMKKHGAPDEEIARVQLAFVYFADEEFRDALNKWVAEMASMIAKRGDKNEAENAGRAGGGAEQDGADDTGA